MNIPLCNRCPKPAFLRVDANTVLCAECWNITWGIVTDRLKADFDNSVSDGVPVHVSTLGRDGAFSDAGLPASSESCGGGKVNPRYAPATSGSVKAEVASGPQASIPSVGDTMDGNATVAAVQAPGPGAAAVASSSCDDGIPEFLRRTG